MKPHLMMLPVVANAVGYLATVLLRALENGKFEAAGSFGRIICRNRGSEMKFLKDGPRDEEVSLRARA